VAACRQLSARPATWDWRLHALGYDRTSAWQSDVTLDERADRVDELQKQIWRLEWALGVFRKQLAELPGEPVNPRVLRLVK
jgi:hypothetical protein